MDPKTIEKLANQLGVPERRRQAEEKIKAYEHKSDEEVLGELLKIQKTLNAAGLPREQQISLVESLMPMMNEQQKTRLRKLIGLLNQNV